MKQNETLLKVGLIYKTRKQQNRDITTKTKQKECEDGKFKKNSILLSPACTMIRLMLSDGQKP